MTWAVACAHEQGIVHRDIKPSNILLNDGIAYLSDFGLAALKGMLRITVEGQALGSPIYMAPEQFDGADGATPTRDVFALGLLLYHLFANRHPFLRPDEMALPMAIAMDRIAERARAVDYVPLCDAVPGAPAPLEGLVRKALAAHPDDRYEDAEALLRALEPVTIDDELGLG